MTNHSVVKWKPLSGLWRASKTVRLCPHVILDKTASEFLILALAGTSPDFLLISAPRLERPSLEHVRHGYLLSFTTKAIAAKREFIKPQTNPFPRTANAKRVRTSITLTLKRLYLLCKWCDFVSMDLYFAKKSDLKESPELNVCCKKDVTEC